MKEITQELKPLTSIDESCTIEIGEWYSLKIKYRFQVHVPKRQILH